MIRNSQKEYTAVLNQANARERQLSQSVCVTILMEKGYCYRQAQTAVYNYRRENGLIGR